MQKKHLGESVCVLSNLITTVYTVNGERGSCILLLLGGVVNYSIWDYLRYSFIQIIIMDDQVMFEVTIFGGLFFSAPSGFLTMIFYCSFGWWWTFPVACWIGKPRDNRLSWIQNNLLPENFNLCNNNVNRSRRYSG